MGAHTSILDPFPLRQAPLLVPCSLFLLDLNGGGGGGRLNLHLHCRLNRRPFSLSLQRVAIPAQLADIPPACLAHPILQELVALTRPSIPSMHSTCKFIVPRKTSLQFLFFPHRIWESSCSNSICHGKKVWKEFQICCFGGKRSRRPCLPPRSTCLS